MKPEKLQIPRFGREQIIGGFTTVTIDSKEAEIIKIAEKVNEIIDFLAPL